MKGIHKKLKISEDILKLVEKEAWSEEELSKAI